MEIVQIQDTQVTNTVEVPNTQDFSDEEEESIPILNRFQSLEDNDAMHNLVKLNHLE